MNIAQLFLVAAAVGLTPIALSYGVNPQASLKFFFNITVQGVNQAHIFRAVMGLYGAFIVFWVLGARNKTLTRPALYSLVAFMLGLALGRALSLVVDGMPHWLLFLYMVLELLFSAVGIIMLQQLNKMEARNENQTCCTAGPAGVDG